MVSLRRLVTETRPRARTTDRAYHRGAMVEDDEGRVLSVHFGRSANCSSVGSVVDVLFVSSVVGTALLGAVAVLMRRAGDARDEERDEEHDEERDEDRPDPG